MKKKDKNNPFKAPEGYFEAFNHRLAKKRARKDFPENSGFKVPNGYFEGLPQALAKAVGQRPKVIKINAYRPYLWAAASLAILFALALALQNNGTSDTSFSDLAQADIEAYFNETNIGLSSYEIAEVLPVDEVLEMEMIDLGISEADMADYLNENIEDINELNLDNKDDE